MAAPNRLIELEKEAGEKLVDLIPRVVNQEGSQKSAAQKLNMAESTLGLWLRQNGYVVRKQWVRLDNASGQN